MTADLAGLQATLHRLAIDECNKIITGLAAGTYCRREPDALDRAARLLGLAITTAPAATTPSDGEPVAAPDPARGGDRPSIRTAGRGQYDLVDDAGTVLASVMFHSRARHTRAVVNAMADHLAGAHIAPPPLASHDRSFHGQGHASDPAGGGGS